MCAVSELQRDTQRLSAHSASVVIDCNLRDSPSSTLVDKLLAIHTQYFYVSPAIHSETGLYTVVDEFGNGVRSVTISGTAHCQNRKMLRNDLMFHCVLLHIS